MSYLERCVERASVFANNHRKYDITFAPKEQREAVRQLVYLILTRDMSTFNPDRFKHWLKETDTKFRKVSLMLKFEIRDRFVYFRVKEVRNGRIIYQFESSTRVPFDERDVVLTCEELNPAVR